MRNMKKRICVIGAGAAGLCAARNLSNKPDVYNFTVFEKTSSVGGTWVYTEKTELDDNKLPIHSSMYDNLKTNIPKEIMGYPDFPFKQSGYSFAHRTVILQYLEDYAKHYNLFDYIKLNHHVTNVEPTHQNGDVNRTWNVTVTNLIDKTDQLFEFDGIIVCNGHYSVPYIPDIANMSTFQGQICHSHCYRNPNVYCGKTVVVLGAASSGMDIALEVSTFAKQVYLCHNFNEPLVSELPANVRQSPGIDKATSDGFVLRDGSAIQADALILCTGYLFNFPFLSDKCQVEVDDNRVTPLYKHLIHQKFPELCFIGLPLTVIPFPMFDFQVKYYLQVLERKIELPTEIEMAEEENEDFQNRLTKLNMVKKYAHRLGAMQWDYFKELTSEKNPLPNVARKIYERVERQRKNNIRTYKSEEYKILDDENYVYSIPNVEEENDVHNCCGGGFQC